MYFKSQNYKLVNYAMNLLTSRNIVCPFTDGGKEVVPIRSIQYHFAKTYDYFSDSKTILW